MKCFNNLFSILGSKTSDGDRFYRSLKIISILIAFLLGFLSHSSPVFAASVNRWVTVGAGTNSIAYSDDGASWTGLGTSIFSNNGYAIAWNGTRFVAGGAGTNTLAYSSDGITWTGIGTSIFSTQVYGIAWNGTRFVAVGSGTNTIAYSSDGITWTGLGTSIFSAYGYGIAWNGTRFVASGNGTNGLAYSSDGITWTGVGTSIIADGRSIAWNGTRFVAVAIGTNTIAYSSDGITWTGEGNTIFSTIGYGIAWNGTRFVAGGAGTNTLAYSSDGITWTGIGTSIFSTDARGIAWNGTRFVAGGAGTNTLAYSSDGITWTGIGTSIFSTRGQGVASAPAPNLVPVQPALETVGVAVPGSVSDLSATSGDGSVALNWTSPSPGDSPITDYTVQYRVYGATPWLAFAHSASTSTSINVTGLSNGIRYEFSVMAINTQGTAAISNISNTIPMEIYFQDNFESLTLGSVIGQNGWTTGGDGTWSVATGDGGKMLSGSTGSHYYTHFAANGSSQLTNQRVKVDFQAVSSGSTPHIWLRRSSATGDGSGYFLDHSTSAVDTWYISKNSGVAGAGYSLLTTSPVNNPKIVDGNWYTIEFEVINNTSNHPVISFYIYSQGGTKPVSPLFTYTDTADLFQSGYVALGSNTAATNFDNIVVYGTSLDSVNITVPSRSVSSAPQVATLSVTDESGIPFYIPYIQTSTTLTTTATVGSSILPSGGGVKFVLNEGLGSEQVQYDLSSPFSVNFTNLTKGTYTLDTYVVNSSQVVQTGVGTHDRATNIGIGDIITAIGDSITMGYAGSSYGSSSIGNWLNAPAGSFSLDYRNYPQYGPQGGLYYKSFLSQLNDSLSTYYGYPVFIMNEGWGGYKTSDYIALMATTQWTNRQTALQPNKWIVDLGVNDAGASVSTSTFQTNLQTIISSLINNYGATPRNIFLSRPNYATSSPYTTVLPTYLGIVDGLVTSNGLSQGADFYTYFLNHNATYYVDIVHPNVSGFTQIARLNYVSMLQPSNLSISQNAGTITLNWNSLSSTESTINGYKVKYGTTSGSYSTTVDVGNVTTKTITGLISGQTYYFVVSAYDNDAFSPNSTQNSSEVSILYDFTAPSLSSKTTFSGWYTSNQTSTFTYTDPGSGVASGNPATCVITTEGAGQTCTVTPNVCDAVGNCNTTPVVSNGANIDKSVPTTPSIPSTTTPTNSSTQTWSWTAATDSISGILNYLWRTTGTVVTNGTSATNNVVTSLTEGIYNFFVRAVDNAGNQGSESSAGTLTVDQTASSVTSVSSNTPTSTGVTITWTTGENSTSKVDYGLTTNYGTTTPETDTSTRVLSHSVAITNLASCTTYHYRVKSKDSALNEVVGSDNSFTTADCTASASVDSQSSSQVTIGTGGTLSLLDGNSHGIGLSIPASFSSSDANFQAHQLDTSTVLTTTSNPTGYQAVGDYIYELKALTDNSTTITTFDNPITITMSYGATDIVGIDESTLKIYRWNGSVWNQGVGCVVNTTAKTVTCTTTHFSTFGLFGQATTTPTSTQSQNSNTGNSSSSNNSAPTCNDSAPLAPELFQIDVKGTSAKLFFTPLQTTNKFYVSFSTKNTAEEHGAEVTLAREGVQSYTINVLKPNTTYYFKVRGQIGCTPGAWSNIVKATSKSSGIFGRSISYYMNTLKTKVSSVFSSIKPQSKSSKSTTSPSNEPTSTLTPTQPQTNKQNIVTQPLKKQTCVLWWCW